MQWAAYGVDLPAIAETMDRLVADGWPSVFIFLFDQPWKLSMRLFDLMPELLADTEAVLEASMYAWALEKLEKPKKGEKFEKKEKVGANFGVPHRDITFKNCHNPADGSPDILSIWIPIVDVDTSNGCMYVIPREKDPQFAKDEVPKDQDPFSFRFPYSDVTPLAPSKAGTTLVWHPNLIHWGASCSPSSPLPPRKSIAMAFRVRDSTRASTPKEIDRYGRKPFLRDELLTGGPNFKGISYICQSTLCADEGHYQVKKLMIAHFISYFQVSVVLTLPLLSTHFSIPKTKPARLKMIAKSLMLYNVWYPEYAGFDIGKLAP
jgi:ectoine hydroxylase-related dioxygenase (phytanoyl-CoA dioxygenase family)